MRMSRGSKGMKPKTGRKMGAGMTPGMKPMKTVRGASVKPTASGITFKPNMK